LRSATPRCLRARHHALLHVLHVLLHPRHLAHHARLPGLCRLRLWRGALGDGEACRGDSGEAGGKGK
jgi:hypothetical protein